MEPSEALRGSTADLETAREWAVDPSTSPIALDNLYKFWPEVHAELAANPSTPQHLLVELAEAHDTRVLAALRGNESARALSIRPTPEWTAPQATNARPAPAAERRYPCPNTTCSAYVTPDQLRCTSCGAELKVWHSGAITTGEVVDTDAATGESDVVGLTTVPFRPAASAAYVDERADAEALATKAATTREQRADRDDHAGAAVAAGGAAALVGAGALAAMADVEPSVGAAEHVPTVEEAARAAGYDVTEIHGMAPVAAVQSHHESFGDRLRRMVPRSDHSTDPAAAHGSTGLGGRWRKIGPIGMLAVFGSIALIAASFLIGKIISGTGTKTAKTTNTRIVPPNPATTLKGSLVTAAPKPAPAAAAIPETPTVLATSETNPNPPAQPPATNPAPKPAPTVAPTTAPQPKPSTTVANVVKPTTTTTIDKVAADTTKAGSITQDYANALARADAATVSKMNPSKSTDLSGYRYLDSSTVIPVAVSPNGGSLYTMKLGLVAQERLPSGDQTKLFCATWVVDVAKSQISEKNGRTVRTVSGLSSASNFVKELQKACA
jgi:outer membrane biosynthesis protein TonB